MKTDRCLLCSVVVASALFATAPVGSLAGDASPGTASLMEIALPATRRALEAATPGGLRLTNVSTKGSKVAFSGLAETTDQIKVYLHALNRNTAFRNVALVQMAKDRTDGLFKFDMEAEVACARPVSGGPESLCKPAGSK